MFIRPCMLGPVLDSLVILTRLYGGGSLNRTGEKRGVREGRLAHGHVDSSWKLPFSVRFQSPGHAP